MSESIRLGNLATVLRSKIAGPFLLSVEAFFDNDDTLKQIQHSNAITRTTVSRAYGIAIEDVRAINWYNQVPSVKCVIWPSERADAIHCRDIYGSQSHMPFADLLVDLPRELD